jgi:hypothetical protein
MLKIPEKKSPDDEMMKLQQPVSGSRLSTSLPKIVWDAGGPRLVLDGARSSGSACHGSEGRDTTRVHRGKRLVLTHQEHGPESGQHHGPWPTGTAVRR